MIGIIDYGMGNLLSVEKAFRYIGQDVVVSSDAAQLKKADKIVLPGVGAFDDALYNLKKAGVQDVIYEAVSDQKPFLGICLGMQLLFDSSEETSQDTPSKGLGILPGSILKIPAKPGYKVPQIGWNSIQLDPKCPLFDGIDQGSYVYFVHSYYLKAKNRGDVVATVDYSVPLDVAVWHNSVFAVQFHPEKSGEVGLSILKNFVKM